MIDFDRFVQCQQICWRFNAPVNQAPGFQNKRRYPWIMPRIHWEQGLWEGIRSGTSNSLPDYLSNTGVQKHDGCHNLKSSWMLCANLYFPFRQDKPLLAGFLQEKVLDTIVTVDSVELEYAEKYPLDPTTLLGEPVGQRGRNQTSPDIAFVVSLKEGKGLILTENKFTEHSFYSCSGRDKKYNNPDSERCMKFQELMDNLSSNCYQMNWANGDRTNRTYWNYLLPLSAFAHKTLRRCPAATTGYQLFRQHALAEAFARSGKYSTVVSCVAYDDRNDALKSCLHGTGIEYFTKDWDSLFHGKAKFASFTHQKWVDWVRKNDQTGRWKGWLRYIEDRYEL